MIKLPKEGPAIQYQHSAWLKTSRWGIDCPSADIEDQEKKVSKNVKTRLKISMIFLDHNLPVVACMTVCGQLVCMQVAFWCRTRELLVQDLEIMQSKLLIFRL